MFKNTDYGCDVKTILRNFRPVRMSGNFSLERYAFGVYMELHKALEGLVEENVTI